MEQKYWLAVVSADHVAVGAEAGFAQIAHGKAVPLRRMGVGDGIIYYSPRKSVDKSSAAGNKLQMFTALAVITGDQVYQVDMGGGFRPYRRNATYVRTQPLALAEVKQELDFGRNGANPGAVLRFGFLQLSAGDFWTIAARMTDNAALSRLHALVSSVQHL